MARSIVQLISQLQKTLAANFLTKYPPSPKDIAPGIFLSAANQPGQLVFCSPNSAERYGRVHAAKAAMHWD